MVLSEYYYDLFLREIKKRQEIASAFNREDI
jgi:hypothetical protein